jgi:hypothetical protein
MLHETRNKYQQMHGIYMEKHKQLNHLGPTIHLGMWLYYTIIPLLSH